MAHEISAIDALARMADAAGPPDVEALLLVFAFRHRCPDLLAR